MAVAHGNVAGLLRKHGLTELKKVGEGSFGKALLVRAEDGQKLICKMVDVSKASRKELEESVKEGKLLAELRHPYIVRYRDNFTESGWLCILMDYCEGGDLTAKITEAKKHRKPLSEDQVLRWFVQGILALKYIHDKHVLHRDLKPSNFFLSKSGAMKMGDFGIAKVLACTIAVAKTQIGTPYYLSPELCQEKPYTFSSDIWAMGCILYELCALKVPFDAPNIPGLVQKIVKAPIPSVPATYSSFIKDLVVKMLDRNPDRRPSSDQILQMPRLQSIVKQMLDEAQEAAQAADDSQLSAVQAQPERSLGDAASDSPGLKGKYASSSGTYSNNDLVEYYSSSHGDWLPATVQKVDGEGRIIIDLKPNTWISREDQASKVRPRGGPKAVAPSPRPASRGSSPSVRRSPSAGGLEKPNGLPPRAGASPIMGGPGSRPGSRAGSPLHRRSPAQVAGAALVGGGSRPGSRAASPLHRAPSPRAWGGDAYQKNDLVEYWSVSHGEWLPAQVINTDLDGRIIIDLKPNTWIPKEDQVAKVRRRPGAGVGSRAGSRAPSVGASPQMNRNPSADRFGAPLRAASPRRAPSPGRAMSPAGRAASPSWRSAMGEAPGRAASPRRNADVGTPRRPPGMPPGSGGARGVADSPLRAGGRNMVNGYGN
mmetsp:Transcript_93008/g.165417  ORF Transcript_93008/g.165417 Transcript_93008/m.165417 type:complete len:653 (+) Transcript_93008:43-2001(+)|eukprot:CAMPEP_0197632724 /NCGR_PEP_ID=MMETSP1338-20131121/9331_1 /TAXON_ID=43686 ORGANISM="Pelagodinium beii, Strain RCC1491" /NCGR_SAMPLE_ID=MMETSP1338 /ASSEMBLY_ACC=CAM_ASM_000754 /LENGTH=652 /DNA_ID=CAMNT_0043204291 /DNA_START=43 /DNA_END=2001 /DNA_ORIENTATION=+